jgi:CheY-like chemotaxis protein
VRELLERERFEEALAELYGVAEARPGDGSIDAAIAFVRARMAQAAIDRLGSPEGVITRSDGDAPDLEADQRYVLSRVRGDVTVGELLQASTLGAHRTARVLHELAGRSLIRIRMPSATEVGAQPAARALVSVVLADANQTQASLLRTILRVAVGRSVDIQTASDADSLLSLSRRIRPGLVLLDYRLPGRPDGLDTVRSLRSVSGLVRTPALIVTQSVEAEYVRSRLPVACGVLVRPIERVALATAIRELVPLAMTS